MTTRFGSITLERHAADEFAPSAGSSSGCLGCGACTSCAGGDCMMCASRPEWQNVNTEYFDQLEEVEFEVAKAV